MICPVEEALHLFLLLQGGLGKMSWSEMFTFKVSSFFFLLCVVKEVS